MIGYDDRVGVAIGRTLSARDLHILGPTFLIDFQLYEALRNLFEEPDPTKPVSAYVNGMKGRDVLGLYEHVRVLRQEMLLGRLTDVVESRPAAITGEKCTRSAPRKCYAEGQGYLRLWIDHDRPYILQAKVPAPKHLRRLRNAVSGYTFRVVDVQQGVGPTDADLAYQPPVPVTRARPTYVSTGGGSISGKPDAPFLAVPSPRKIAPELHVNEGAMSVVADHPTISYDYERLFSDGNDGKIPIGSGHRFTVPYARGKYLLVQEWVQVHGLPASLEQGTPRTIGSCQIWSGTFNNGQQWVAFAKGPLSFLVSSNDLTQDGLAAYAGTAWCS